MNLIEAALRRTAEDLGHHRLGWALIGGWAVALRAEPRFTRDVDVAIAVDDDSAAEAAVRVMLDAGYGLRSTIEHEETGRLATVRLMPPHQPTDGEVLVDVLFASSGIEREIVNTADQLEVFPERPYPVARTGHLIALKLLARDDARRPQDLADLHALLAVATEADLALARSSCALITERGYHRDRDLASALEELLRR